MNSRACVRVGSGMSDWFPYLFNTYMDGVVRGINAGLLGRGLSVLSEDGRE